eukprot:TRINITY_DN5170_c1_g1_i2.p1 TRINITY_DN5170_c1_g1~~TRINITY_DN5170_c1_g1_i2.p1  ORF type:complete len:471 (-),score=95.20 TRINITY_DN5170_c1_g1_i2:71-1483(-)
MDEEWGGGELLFAGGTNWELVGKPKKVSNAKEQERQDKREEMYPDLLGPHRFKNLLGVRIGLIGTGCSANHAVAVDISGTTTYIWGRNDKCQLGLGDNIQRNMPIIVESLRGQKVVSAACGRHHTVVVVGNGKSFAAGSNKLGQLGIGSMSSGKEEELVDKFRECAVISGARKVSCGIDFTIWLCGENGKLYAAGSPEFGQLGDGTDHAYNSKDSSIKIVYDPQPKPLLLKSLEDVNVVDFVCGANHSLAYDTGGRMYSWGFGGYGRLGHKIQQDEHAPRQIDTLTGRLTVPKNANIGAGSTGSFCTVTESRLLFSWGKLKQSGDSMMYPEFFQDLSGWNIRSLSCGMTTFAVAAEKSCITWGAAQNGQLGYGPDGKKSSANPDKVQALEDMHTEQVACGLKFTLFLVDPNDSKIENLPVWDCEPIDPFHQLSTASKSTAKKAQPPTTKKAATKRKAETKEKASKKKKIK